MPAIPLTTARFPFSIFPHEIEDFKNTLHKVVMDRERQFRNAGFPLDIFHNHDEEERTINRYPLVQVHSRGDNTNGNGKNVMIVGLGKGAAFIDILEQVRPDTIFIKGRSGKLSFIPSIEKSKISFALSKTDLKEYYLFEWLALNKDNFHRYKDELNFKARVELLESILQKNILGMMTGAGLEPKKPPTVVITEITQITHDAKKLHGNTYFSFNLAFATNVALPGNIGIGLNSSFGFGKIVSPYSKPSPLKVQTLQKLADKVL